MVVIWLSGGAFEEEAFEGGGEVFGFGEADDAIVAVGCVAGADDDDFAVGVVGGHGVAGDAEGEGGSGGGVGEVGGGDVVVGDAGGVVEVAVLARAAGGDAVEDGDVAEGEGVARWLDAGSSGGGGLAGGELVGLAGRLGADGGVEVAGAGGAAGGVGVVNHAADGFGRAEPVAGFDELYLVYLQGFGDEAEFFFGRGAGGAGGFDVGEVGLADVGFGGQVVER